MKQVLFLLPLALAVQLYAEGSFTNGLIAYYPFNGNANDETTNVVTQHPEVVKKLDRISSEQHSDSPLWPINILHDPP